MPADLRIRIDPDGRLHLLHAFGRNLDVEIHDDRRARPEDRYRSVVIASGVDTSVTLEPDWESADGRA